MVRKRFSPRLISLISLLVMFVFSACAAPAASPARDAAASQPTYHAPTAMEAPAAEESAASAESAAESATDGIPPQPPSAMFFDNYGVNGFVDASQDNLSTFGVDVDTGSYTVMRNYITDGWLPPADAVRVEEFVNYFDYDYPLPSRDETFTIVADAAPSPFTDRPTRRIMRVGIQGYDVPADQRRDVALTFIIDVSGSMDYENRLGLVKRGLTLLTEQLRPTDSVAIVVYGTNARLVLPMTPLGEKDAVLNAIRSLHAEGSTNAEAGLLVGYRHAWENFRPEANKRIVLASDGVANVGVVDPNGILRTIQEYAGQDLTLTTVGFGMGNYNDVLMEQLADNGDGFYAYVDTIDEARKLFVEDLAGTIETIAMDARVQVEFNPAAVAGYRLVGYENRDMADDDFRNDEKDAGEIGSGHSVTALYELELRGPEDEAVVLSVDDQAVGDESATFGDGVLAVVRFRWRDPRSGQVTELAHELTGAEMAGAFPQADPGFQLAVVAGAYADVLRQSPWAVGLTPGEILPVAEEARFALTAAGRDRDEVTELVDLIWSADEMWSRARGSTE
ncbi:MAG: von Willebrand factor type A domain-containing protein [Caldilineaceae bacterium]|nr:von Willebrand factor type A domain-containing protein [Caldilineaceae bacterium]